MDSCLAEGKVKDMQDSLEALHNHPLVPKPDMCHAHHVPLDRQVVDDGYPWGSFHEVVQLHQWGSSAEQLLALKDNALSCRPHHPGKNIASYTVSLKVCIYIYICLAENLGIQQHSDMKFSQNLLRISMSTQLFSAR